MLHWKKPKVKAVSVDTLEYQGTLGTMGHPAEMVEMGFEVTKVIEVSLEEKFFTIELASMQISLYLLGFNFIVCNDNVSIIIIKKVNLALLDQQAMMVTRETKEILVCIFSINCTFEK